MTEVSHDSFRAKYCAIDFAPKRGRRASSASLQTLPTMGKQLKVEFGQITSDNVEQVRYNS